jgi:hypothetical protein
MKLNPGDIQTTSRKLIEKIRESDLGNRFSIACSGNWEIIIPAVAALVVGTLLLLIP